MDPFRYFTEGIMSTAIDPIQIKCTSADLYRFYAPAPQTCEEYTREFFTYATGYLNNPNATGSEVFIFIFYENTYKK